LVFLINIPLFIDHEIFPFKIKFVKRETVKTDYGKIMCLKFVPVVQEGRVFKDEDDMHLWISDDANHVPIRIQSELIVGSIKIDLKEYKGLANPLAIVKWFLTKDTVDQIGFISVNSNDN